jgi:hypothetical protein
MRSISYIICLSLFSGIGNEEYDLMRFLLADWSRTENKNHYETIIKTNFPSYNPFPHSDLDKSYLLMRHQDRHNYNHPTKICQEGLERRIENKRVKEIRRTEKAQNEKKIQESFSRKIKNKTYEKRHHPRAQ